MKAKPQYWRKRAISRHPRDIEDPANAPYLYESPDGDRYIDWNNPGHKLENRAERISVLASGDQDRILKYYTELYYSRLAGREGMCPDNAGAENVSEEKSVTFMPKARPHIPADEVLQLIRGLKDRVNILEKQKVLLSQAAADSGCPVTAASDCPIRDMKAETRQNPACAECWRRYADATIKKLPSKITGTLPA